MLADNARETIALGVFFAQEQILPKKFLLAGGARDEQLQVLQLDGFLNEIERALFHRGDSFFNGTVRGDENHGDHGVGAARFAENVEAGGTRKLQVGEDYEIAPVAYFVDGRGAVGCFYNRVPSLLESLAQHGAQFSFVLDQKEGFHRALYGRAQPGSPPAARNSSSRFESACLSASSSFCFAAIASVFLMMSLRS